MAADPFRKCDGGSETAGYSNVKDSAKVRLPGGDARSGDSRRRSRGLRGRSSAMLGILATSGMLRIARNPKHKGASEGPHGLCWRDQVEAEARSRPISAWSAVTRHPAMVERIGSL